MIFMKKTYTLAKSEFPLFVYYLYFFYFFCNFLNYFTCFIYINEKFN